MNPFEKNISSIYQSRGKAWLADLPKKVEQKERSYLNCIRCGCEKATACSFLDTGRVSGKIKLSCKLRGRNRTSGTKSLPTSLVMLAKGLECPVYDLLS